MKPTELPPIPIPTRVRELLRDYPDLIVRLEKRLARALERPTHPPIEGAIWAFEDTLEGFVGDAQQDRRRAEEAGDEHALAQANAKFDAAARAGTRNDGLRDLREVEDYFEHHREAFR